MADKDLNELISSLKGVTVAVGALGQVQSKVVKDQASFGANLKAGSDAARLQGEEIKKLSGLVTDTFSAFASGGDPLKVIATQGLGAAEALASAASQGVGLKGVLAGVAGNLMGAGAALGPYGRIAEVLLQATQAVYQYGQSQAQVEQMTYGLARATGLSGRELSVLAERSAAAGNVSISTAQGMMESYLRLGVTSAPVLQRAIELTDDYAAATKQDAAGALQELGKVLADPVQNMGLLNGKVEGLDGKTRELVKTLVRENDLAGAQALILQRVAKSAGGTADKVLDLDKAFRSARNGASNFFLKMKEGAWNFFNPSEEKVANTYQGFGPTLMNRVAAQKAENRRKGEEATRTALSNKATDYINGATADFEELDAAKSQLKVINDAITQKVVANMPRAIEARDRVAKRVKSLEESTSGKKPEADKAGSGAPKAAPDVAQPRISTGGGGPDRVEQLKTETVAAQKATEANWTLANAYGGSELAAIQAQAKSELLTKGFSDQADTASYVAQQVALSISKTAISVAQQADSLSANAKAQKDVNDLVADGSLSSAEAAEQLRDEAAGRQLLALSGQVDAETKEKLQGIYRRLTAAQAENNEQVHRAQMLASIGQQRDTLETLSEEARLVGAGNIERSVALAQLKAEQELKAKGFNRDTARPEEITLADSYVENAKEIAKQTAVLKTMQDGYNASLTKSVDLWTQLQSKAQATAQGLSSSFGDVGKAVGGLVTVFAAYQANSAKLTTSHTAKTKELSDAISAAGGDTVKRGALEKQLAEETTRYDQEMRASRIQAYGDAAGAAKGFFKEHSVGYSAIEGIERGYRLWQAAETIRAMALGTAETTQGIANSAARGVASAASGAAKIFESLGPWGFPVVAAMVGVLASFGLRTGGGGGVAPGANDMKSRQEKQGSGSVLGDDKAKSESLEKALTHAQGYENKDLEYGNAMVRSLRSIDDQIGVVASALAKSFGAGGMLSTEGLNLGKTGTTASLSNFGFSKSTTRTLQDQGIQFDATTLGAIADGGLSGSTYQQVLETTRKKKLFVLSSSKSKVITETGALDPDFLVQVTGLIELLGKGVSDAAEAIGATDFEALLANFKIDLGKLSFKEMTGTQIEEALSAIFGKLGDDMAKTAVPAIAQFQKVGEGAFETLVRVARQYEVIDTTLKSVGMTFGKVDATLGTVGISSLEARQRLVDLVGGLDNLTDQASFFAEHFLSEEQRLKPVQNTVNETLTKLKQPTNMTRDDFTALVMKQDVSTKEGAELYAALMKLAPAFDKVATAAERAKAAGASIQDQIDELTMTPAELLKKSRDKEMLATTKLHGELGKLLETLYKLQDAAKVDEKRTSIQDQIDELTMSPAELLKKSRDKEMIATKALDGELGKLLQTLYDLQDAAKVDEKRKSIQDQIDELVMTPAQLLTKSRTAEMEAVKALDATLVPFLEKLWKLQDAAEAAKLAIDRSNMLAGLMEAQGRTEEAKQLRRSLALAQIKDPVQKMYQEQTWAAEDAAAKVSAAREVLTQAYQREQEAIQATKDKFKELSTSLRAFSASLTGTIAGTDPGTRYRRSRESFLSTAAMARLGDPDAMGRLQSEGEAFTAASLDYVATSQDYLRDVGLVRSAVDEAADTADRQVSIAQRQLDALDASVKGLIEIKASVVSVEQAILSLRGALGEARAAGVVSVGGSSLGLADPVPNPAGGNTGGGANDPNKTLDGKYYYDAFLGQLAYTESLRDPAFYAANNIPFDVMTPGTESYAILQTYKIRNKDQYDYQEQMRLIQGYATGGSFEVGGSGPPDSKFFGLALSPGEAVNVRRADQKNDQSLIRELRRLREELADLRATSVRIATSNDKMERTLTNVTEGGRAMQTQAAA